MRFKILHLNIERDKHINNVLELLKTKKPDVVCFQEAILEDIKKISKELKYLFVFAPMVIINGEDNQKEEGSAILSKFPIIETNKYRYDDNKTNNTPIRTKKEIISDDNGERPKDRFLYDSILLTASIKCNSDTTLIITTTDFPVTDHSTKGLLDHELNNIKKIDEIENTRNYLDRLIPIIRSIKKPMIFTADLNNPRGEYIYDTIAHELIDIIPSSVSSTIDPQLHRRGHDLKLTVDTIMTSPDISIDNFEIVEGISDHKGLIASLII